MAQSLSDLTSGHIVVTLRPQTGGHYVCEAMVDLGKQSGSIEQFHGQSKKYAIALALEKSSGRRLV